MFDSGWESDVAGAPSRAWSVEVPGPDLVVALAGSEATDVVDDAGFDAAERIGAWEAVMAWATARQQREISAYVRARQGRVKQAPGPLAEESDAVAMEVAALCRVAPRTGEYRCAHATALVERLPHTLAALEAGRISMSHARVVLEQTEQCDDEHAHRIDAALWNLPERERTPTQLRDTVRRIILRLDPESLLRRVVKAREERTVRYWSDDDGATGVISARMPAEQARGVFAVIDAVARGAGDPEDGEKRTLGNKRADALRDLVMDGASGMAWGPGTDNDDDDDEAAAGDDATTSSAGEDTPPGAGDSGSPTSEPEREPAPSGREPADGTVRSTDSTDAGSPARGPVSTTVRVTIPWEVLAGLSERPAELEGHGPIPADTARALARGAGAFWQRLLTDPVTGTAEHLDLHRYRPPKSLQEFVYARDLTCAAPGCRVPAARCDLDHTIAYDHAHPDGKGGPGRTASHNLHPFCRGHHVIKTHTGWTCQPVPDPHGARTPALRWTAATGRSWIVRAPTIDPPPWERTTGTEASGPEDLADPAEAGETPQAA